MPEKRCRIETRECRWCVFPTEVETSVKNQEEEFKRWTFKKNDFGKGLVALRWLTWRTSTS
jgi:hypothetical protein